MLDHTDMPTKRTTLTYDLKKSGRIVYRGATIDPERREREHRDAALAFDRLVPTSHRMTPQGAKDRDG